MTHYQDFIKRIDTYHDEPFSEATLHEKNGAKFFVAEVIMSSELSKQEKDRLIEQVDLMG